MAEWFRALDLNLEVPGSNPPFCFLDLFYGSPELEFNSLSAASHQLGFLVVVLNAQSIRDRFVYSIIAALFSFIIVSIVSLFVPFNH